MLSSNTSAVSGDTKYIEDYFSSYLYTGNGSTQTITNGLDLATKGGLVWIKKRGAGTADHHLYDTVRGATYQLASNATYSQLTRATGLTAFNSNGFSIGAYSEVNGSPDPTVSWSFAKTAKFFDVVTWTGNGTSQNIAHSLGSVPGCIVVKATSGVSNWFVYHRSLGNANLVYLNATSASASTTIWNNTDPTSTQFSINGTSGNASGVTYVAYLYAHDAGGFGLTGTDNVISCGSTTGAVTLGWEPQFLFYKSSTNAQDWQMIDNMRGWTSSEGVTQKLSPNTTAAETSGETVRFSATGFDGSFTGTVIYIAIRRGPMKVPTDATKVFNPTATTAASGTVITTGFPVDLQFQRNQYTVNTLYPMRVIDRLRGFSTTPTLDTSSVLITSSTAAETTGSWTRYNTNTGYQVSSGNNGDAQIYWNFRRAPSFFDEVCYTGTGTAGQTYTHNLGVVPELMIVKTRSGTGNWAVYTATTAATNVMYLNTTNASFGASGFWNNTAPTSSVFSVGNNGNVNDAATTYVAYLFATCAGVSKVFSYTGNGSSQTINCGFTGGARWIMIKRTDSTGDWYVWDTARGIVSGNDPHLSLNTTAAEVTSDDTIDTDSTGFIVNQLSATNVNVSSATYIGIAIA
jgi:hypothetical protein